MCVSLTAPAGTPSSPGGERDRAGSSADTQAAIHAWLHHGDQAAARRLVETHRPLVRRVIRGWLPRDWMVEEVVQEVFIKTFRTLHRVDTGRRFEAWLCRIARNTCAKALRGWHRRHVLNAEDMGITDFDAFVDSRRESGAPQPADDAHALIQRLLSRLHEQDRRIIWLYHAEGLSADHVGRKLGLTPGTVRVRVCRTQRTLREAVQRLRGRRS